MFHHLLYFTSRSLKLPICERNNKEVWGNTIVAKENKLFFDIHLHHSWKWNQSVTIYLNVCSVDSTISNSYWNFEFFDDVHSCDWSSSTIEIVKWIPQLPVYNIYFKVQSAHSYKKTTTIISTEKMKLSDDNQSILEDQRNMHASMSTPSVHLKASKLG